MTTTELILKYVFQFCGCFLAALALWSLVLAGIDWEMERRAEFSKPPIERHRGYTKIGGHHDKR